MQQLKNQPIFIILLALMIFAPVSGFSTVSADTNISEMDKEINSLMNEVKILQEKLDKLKEDNVPNILKEQNLLMINSTNVPLKEAVVTEKGLRSSIAETKKILIEIDKEIKKNKGETRDASRYIQTLNKMYVKAAETELAEGRLANAYFVTINADGNAKKLLSDLKDFRNDGKEISFFKRADKSSTKIYIDLLKDAIVALEESTSENYDKKSLIKAKKVLNDAKKNVVQSNKDYQQKKYPLAFWRTALTYVVVLEQIDILRKTKKLDTKATSVSVIQASTQIEKTESLFSYLKSVNINNFPKTFIESYNKQMVIGKIFLEEAEKSFNSADYSSAYKYAVEAYNQFNKVSQMLKG